MGKDIHVTKKQHFIPREYLRGWTAGKEIWCSFNKQAPFLTSLMKVGNQQYFYKFNPTINEKELMCAKTLFAQYDHQEIFNFWTNLYSGLSKIINGLSQNNDKTQSIDAFSKQVEETINCGLENNFYPFLNKLRSRDKSFFAKDDDKADFCLGLMELNLRTMNMKQRILTSIGDKAAKNGINPDNLWMLTRHQWAIVLGHILLDNGFNLHFLEDSSSSLITGDQPVINSKPEYINGEVTDLEYYCPLSPSLAILLSRNDITNEKLTLEQRDYYNKMIRDESQMQIYSDSEKTLKYVLSL